MIALKMILIGSIVGFALNRLNKNNGTVPTFEQNAEWLAENLMDEVDPDWLLEFSDDVHPDRFHLVVNKLIKKGALVNEARKQAIKELTE